MDNKEKTHRNGLREFSYSEIIQIKTYLKAYYFHTLGENHLDDALELYTKSLSIGGEICYNYLRLETLQSIEQILTEKTKYELMQKLSAELVGSFQP